MEPGPAEVNRCASPRPDGACPLETASGSEPADVRRATARGAAGGGIYENDDDTLPEPVGRWYEADVGDIHVGQGGRRGEQRLVYDEAGNAFFTPDHFRT